MVQEPTIGARSSAGRAPALHAGGRRFDPDRVHFNELCFCLENGVFSCAHDRFPRILGAPFPATARIPCRIRTNLVIAYRVAANLVAERLCRMVRRVSMPVGKIDMPFSRQPTRSRRRNQTQGVTSLWKQSGQSANFALPYSSRGIR